MKDTRQRFWLLGRSEYLKLDSNSDRLEYWEVEREKRVKSRAIK